MAELRLGLLGCGRIAQLVHLEILLSVPGVRLTALADPDPERRAEAARRAPQAAALAGWEEALELDLDAVVVCLPNALHAEAGLAALERGLHLYLEKPLATTLDDGRRVVDAWRRAGTVGMIGFNYRFNALYEAARQHVVAGRLGEVTSARTLFSTAARPLPAWKTDPGAGGGVLLDYASHHVDLLRMVLRLEVAEVSAQLLSTDARAESALVALRFPGGVGAQSLFARGTVDEDSFELFGAAGKLSLDRQRSIAVRLAEAAPELSHRGAARRGARGVAGAARAVGASPHARTKIRAPAAEPSFRAALEHFVAAARSGEPGKPDLVDGLRSLAVIEAAARSAREGRVAIPAAVDLAS